MKVGGQISVTVTNGRFAGKTLLLDVEEFQPYEPSAYAWSAGWLCVLEIRNEVHWFMVDEAGQVWYEGTEDERSHNLEYFEQCGICPAQEAAYETMLAQYEEYEQARAEQEWDREIGRLP